MKVRFSHRESRAAARGLLLLAVLPAAPEAMAAQQRPDSAVVRIQAEGPAGRLRRATARIGVRDAVADSLGILTLVAPPGQHWLVISAAGLLADSVQLRLRAGQDTTLVHRLLPLPGELDELRVSVTRSERRIADEPLRVEVLGREEVEEKLLMTPGDITMMLNETGGLRVQTTSPGLGGASVRIQGLNGRYTAVLADGLPLHGGQVGSLGLLQIPPMDLGLVEVVKGPASALYGGSALGGVVNLVSRRPDGVREALLNATSFGGTDAVAWLASPGDGPAGYTLLVSGHRQGRVDRDGDGWADLAGYRRLVVRPRLFAGDDAGRSLLATAGITAEERTGGTLPGRSLPDGSGYREALGTIRGDLGAVGRTLVGGTWLLTARASGTLLRHRHQFGPAVERDRHLTWFGETAVHRDLGQVTAVAGASVQGEHYRNTDLAGFDYTFVTPGLFAQAEWPASSGLTLAVSARADHHSRYGLFAAPRLSALLRLGGSWTLRASAGTGSLAPTPFTEETEAIGLGLVEPLSGLRAEKARGASIDLGGTMGTVEVNATLFASTVDRAVRLEAGSEGRYRLVNAPGATRSSGADLLARYRAEPWSVTATYTYARASEPGPAGVGRRPVPLTPRHAGGLVASWEREGATRIGVEAYYTGRQALEENPYRGRSRSYLIVGALVEQRVAGVRLFLNLENLTDQRQTRFDPLVLPARSPDGRWTTDAWAPLEGRVINGGVRIARMGGRD